MAGATSDGGPDDSPDRGGASGRSPASGSVPAAAEADSAEDIQLTVRQGEVVALLGANGAGKTTTLRVVSGLVKPMFGRVLLDGEDLAKFSPSARARLGIAHVPECRGLFFGLTVRGLGLVPATAVTALLTALASYRTGILAAVAIAAGLTVLCVLIFVLALQLQLPLFGPWLSFSS